MINLAAVLQLVSSILVSVLLFNNQNGPSWEIPPDVIRSGNKLLLIISILFSVSIVLLFLFLKNFKAQNNAYKITSTFWFLLILIFLYFGFKQDIYGWSIDYKGLIIQIVVSVGFFIFLQLKYIKNKEKITIE